MRGACLLAMIAVAHAQSVALKEPYGPQRSLVSPNGAYALFGVQNALWMEDRRTHERRMVLTATVQTLTLAWSPDSAAFAVNDRALSDVENAYIFDVKTLDRVNLTARITAAAAGFLKDRNGHSYFHVKRWLDARHVEVALYGHTIAVVNGTAFEGGDCFELLYRVSRDGEVEKLGQRVAPLGAKACEAIESAQD